MVFVTKKGRDKEVVEVRQVRPCSCSGGGWVSPACEQHWIETQWPRNRQAVDDGGDVAQKFYARRRAGG